MRVEKIEISGFQNIEAPPISYDLDSEMNILTGKNGSGKTTMLKLVWYLISGNIGHALREVPFNRVKLVTSEYELTISRKGSRVEKIVIVAGDDTLELEDAYDDDGDSVVDAISEANDFLSNTGSSVFFPTFRRIEGGFSLNPPARRLPGRLKPNAVDEALSELSRRMTNVSHTFVSSLATSDIADLLQKRFTDMSEQAHILQADVSKSVIEKIKRYRRGQGGEEITYEEESAELVLNTIQTIIEEMELTRTDILAPFGAITNLVQKILGHQNIRVGSRISFGDVAQAINSDALSAGEKQMLSFLCYNAFYSQSIIFIDEPELSLHVDWQRELFKVLESQETSNQFLVATHSPFIYAKYPENEIRMSSDRGDAPGAGEPA